jgi:hypothetical protein
VTECGHAVETWSQGQATRGSHAASRHPPEALGPELAVVVGGEKVTARAEVVLQGTEWFQEALRVVR